MNTSLPYSWSRRPRRSAGTHKRGRPALLQFFGFERPQPFQGRLHQGDVDLVDVDGVADGTEHRQGEASPEVLAELLEALEQAGNVAQGRVGQAETQVAEALEDTAGNGLGEAQGQGRVHGIQSDAQRDGLAVAE